jgi:hypothetical protein
MMSAVQIRGGEAAPLDPGMEGLLQRGARWQAVHEPGRSQVPGGSDPEMVAVFLVGSPEPARLRSLGVRVGTRAGRVLAADVPRERLREVAAVPGVERMTLARRLEPRLEASIPAVHADSLRQRVGDSWTGWTGEGVLIGIVDSGLDLGHGDFLRPDGSTRVVRYWDQADAAGPPPVGAGGDTIFDYGSDWSAAQIDLGVSRAGDEVGHGTSVAGVAAGDGSASQVADLRYRYTGMAPGADLVVVGLDTFLETSVLDAVQYVFTRAEELGRPAVVNLSLGTQFGPHDGTSPMEEALNSLVGPGRLIVASAGNEGNDFMHAELHVPAGGSDSAVVMVPSYVPGNDIDVFFVDAWYKAPDSMAVTVVTPSGKRFGPVGMGEILRDVLTGEGTLFLGQGTPDPGSGNVEVGIDVSDLDPGQPGSNPRPPASGPWRIVCTDLAGIPGGGEMDLWIPLWILPVSPPGPVWTVGLDPTEEVSSPGTATGVITVGSFNSKGHWLDPMGGTRTTTQDSTFGAPSYFTSRGPTRDGRLKPEVIAPGFVVTTSLSHEITPANLPQYNLGVTGNPDGEHFTLVGTSLAAPHVTGAIALWLDRNGGLTPEMVRTRLEESSVSDPATGIVWNPAAGFGRLDAGALLDGVVPVLAGGVTLEADDRGHPRLVWEGSDESIRALRIERREEEGPWVLLAQIGSGEGGSWIDPDPLGRARYRLLGLRADGTVIPLGEVEWTGALSPRPWLGTPFPNPFSARTRMEVRTASGSRLEAVVVDPGGRAVRRIDPAATGEEGTAWVIWDGTDAGGGQAAAGVYWLLVTRGQERRAAKVVLVR